MKIFKFKIELVFYIVLVFILSNFKIYSADSVCNPDSTISYYFDDNNIKSFSEKMLFKYDEKGNKIESITLGWDKNKKIWYNFSKSNYYYNQKGLTIKFESQRWDSVNQSWIVQRISNYNYNDKGLKTLVYFVCNHQNQPSLFLLKTSLMKVIIR